MRSFSFVTALASVAMYSMSLIEGFVPSSVAFSSRTSAATIGVPVMATKGFGGDSKPKKRQPSEGEIKRKQESSKYDEISGQGGQEYLIFVRQFGSADDSWLPCGTIAVPRGSQVSDAIFANEANLKVSIIRTFPKLGGSEDEFEYGFNLKIYPDDPIEIAKKGNPKLAGPSVGNWISNLLSPVDTSAVAPPTPPSESE